MRCKSPILVVDDDSAVRDSIRVLLESADYEVRDFGSAKAVLASDLFDAGCLIADVCMPEMDGLELQELLGRKSDVPVIIITGHGDVALAVRAMKAGAVDFLEKPFADHEMLKSVDRALEIGSHKRSHTAEVATARNLIAQLTPREQNVLEQIVAGRSNKAAAYALGISPRTIEIHRAHVMDKMNARSLSDLVRIALAAESDTGHTWEKRYAEIAVDARWSQSFAPSLIRTARSEL